MPWGRFASAVLLMVLYHRGTLEGRLPGWIVQTFADLKPFGPLITVGGGLFFAGFRLIDVRKDFSRPGAMTFDVYLVHGVFLMAASLLEKQMGLPDSLFGQAGCLAEILIATCVIYLLSFGAAWVLERFRARRAAH